MIDNSSSDMEREHFEPLLVQISDLYSGDHQRKIAETVFQVPLVKIEEPNLYPKNNIPEPAELVVNLFKLNVIEANGKTLVVSNPPFNCKANRRLSLINACYSKAGENQMHQSASESLMGLTESENEIKCEADQVELDGGEWAQKWGEVIVKREYDENHRILRLEQRIFEYLTSPVKCEDGIKCENNEMGGESDELPIKIKQEEICFKSDDEEDSRLEQPSSENLYMKYESAAMNAEWDESAIKIKQEEIHIKSD